MKNMLEYKGYFTKIEYSKDDHVLYGKIEGIKDLVSFESDKVENIETEFHLAVDDYLELCKELNQSPDKPYSGTFNIRIHPSLHRELALRAIKNGESLNSTVEKALRAYITDSTDKKAEEFWDTISLANYQSARTRGFASSSAPVPLSISHTNMQKKVHYV